MANGDKVLEKVKLDKGKPDFSYCPDSPEDGERGFSRFQIHRSNLLFCIHRLYHIPNHQQGIRCKASRSDD